MKTFQVVGNVNTWERNADMAADILRSIRVDERGTRFAAIRTGIAAVTTDAPDTAIDAVKIALLRSADRAALIAFTMAYMACGNTDEAARTAVIAAGPGSVCMGHYASYRHGTRSRIRVTDEHGTTTDVGASRVARGHDSYARLSGWSAYVILREIHRAIGAHRYTPCGLGRGDRIHALAICRRLAAKGHNRVWVAPHEGMLSGLAIVGMGLNDDICAASFRA